MNEQPTTRAGGRALRRLMLAVLVGAACGRPDDSQPGTAQRTGSPAAFEEAPANVGEWPAFYLSAVRSGDVESIVQLYAEDGVAEDPAGSDPIVGREELRAFYAGVLGTDLGHELAGPVRVTHNAIAFPFSFEFGQARVPVIDVFYLSDVPRIDLMRAYWTWPGVDDGTMASWVDAHLRALSSQDLGTRVSTFSDDAVVECPMGSAPRQGEDAVRGFVEAELVAGAEYLASGPVLAPGGGAALEVERRRKTGDGRIEVRESIHVLEFDDDGRVTSMACLWGPENERLISTPGNGPDG